MSQLLHIDKTPPIAPLPTKPQAAPTFFVDELQDLARLRGSLPSIPRLARLPRRRRHTVLLIPGWKMPEETLYALRTYLRAIGYDAHGWGLGTNRGQPEKDRDRLIPKLQEAYSRHGSKVTLIGWSLGGVIAREVARLHPHKVERVITLATPVIGGPSFTLGADAWGAAECLRIARGIAELDKSSPIDVPVVAFYTKRDRVVSWPACIDRSSRDVRHVRVRSTHFSIGFDPDVWRLIADTLEDKDEYESANVNH